MEEKEETKEEISPGPSVEEMKEMIKPKVEEIKTTLGINEHIEGALCYVLGFVTGLIFLIIERENKFVRFHALQSIATFLPLLIIVSEIERVILSPTIGFSLTIFGILIYVGILSAIWVLIGLLWILLIYKASRGEKYKLPVVGKIAERYA